MEKHCSHASKSGTSLRFTLVACPASPAAALLLSTSMLSFRSSAISTYSPWRIFRTSLPGTTGSDSLTTSCGVSWLASLLPTTGSPLPLLIATLPPAGCSPPVSEGRLSPATSMVLGVVPRLPPARTKRMWIHDPGSRPPRGAPFGPGWPLLGPTSYDPGPDWGAAHTGAYACVLTWVLAPLGLCPPPLGSLLGSRPC